MASMVPDDPQFARSEILRLFNQSQVYLLLGSFITTVGLLAGAFAVLRRRRDPLLLWFACFAILYGVHQCLEYQLLWYLHLRPPVFRRTVIAIGYSVPVPAFFFFARLNILHRPWQVLSWIVTPIISCVVLTTLVFGPLAFIEKTYLVTVLISLLVVVIGLLRGPSRTPDLRLIRAGLFLFIAFALYSTGSDFFHYDAHNLEPFSFAVLLVCLGVVAGRRALAQEQQLSVIQKELDIAKRIQLSILPAEFPVTAGFRVAARYLPMTSVAGDFYDFLVADEEQAGILIADVSGHGVPAALIASMVKLAAAAQLANAANPSALLHGMNAALCGNTQSQFVTAAYIHLRIATGELRYSAAAHPPMLLLRDGSVIRITENGLMLAAFSFATYGTASHQLLPGDRLLLYTDGILEAVDREDEEFGDQRLTALLQKTATLSHHEAADHIIATIQRWSAVQNDDLTVLVCDYSGPGSKSLAAQAAAS